LLVTALPVYAIFEYIELGELVARAPNAIEIWSLQAGQEGSDGPQQMHNQTAGGLHCVSDVDQDRRDITDSL